MTSGGTAHSDQALLADIGGTNARFALARGDEIGPIEYARAADFPGAKEAIAAFLERHAASGTVKAAVLGVAGTVENGRAFLTNSGWIIDRAELHAAFGIDTVHVLNDFEVLAWSLPALKSDDLFALGSQEPLPGAPMLVLGPGTGFGASCLVARDGSEIAIITEAGHATLPAASEREERVIDSLRQRFGHASIERAVSGPGLLALYEALAAIEGVSAPQRDAAAITQAALDGSCVVSGAALEMFCSFLGTVAGNLALTFCARGGVYIAGGIVPRFPDFLARSSFRTRFESKGRYEGYLRDIPTNIIIRPDASFVGLKTFFDRRIAGRSPV
ncbi:MAG: glucokinase [Bradyrhizobium sp.]|uniref:glucokinase n=1 Tax=Bradyrhizobium sp. TaxID=376 RepID=UPI0025BA4D2A|nr:glucokinase [Bradyrhizobium sp.]MBI5260275.1 glucokinase [Bradyrhizobium sp.]